MKKKKKFITRQKKRKLASYAQRTRSGIEIGYYYLPVSLAIEKNSIQMLHKKGFEGTCSYVLHGGHHVAKKSATTIFPEALLSAMRAFQSSTELIARTREPKRRVRGEWEEIPMRSFVFQRE